MTKQTLPLPLVLPLLEKTQHMLEPIAFYTYKKPNWYIQFKTTPESVRDYFLNFSAVQFAPLENLKLPGTLLMTIQDYESNILTTISQNRRQEVLWDTWLWNDKKKIKLFLIVQTKQESTFDSREIKLTQTQFLQSTSQSCNLKFYFYLLQTIKCARNLPR